MFDIQFLHSQMMSIKENIALSYGCMAFISTLTWIVAFLIIASIYLTIFVRVSVSVKKIEMKQCIIIINFYFQYFAKTVVLLA